MRRTYSPIAYVLVFLFYMVIGMAPVVALVYLGWDPLA